MTTSAPSISRCQSPSVAPSQATTRHGPLRRTPAQHDDLVPGAVERPRQHGADLARAAGNDDAHAVLLLVNMFTDNVKPRGRGRPPGQTAQGAAARDRLYAIAIRMISERGYEATTLRDIAHQGGVSVGLLYRYFPGKQAVILALYDDLSAEYARRADAMHPGRWRDRVMFALTASLQVLEPHRVPLRALIPVLVGDPADGLFSASTAFSRHRVQRVFETAVSGASDAPREPLAAALGRLFYLLHLGVLLWWLLDRSARQRTTHALVGSIEQMLPSLAMALRLPLVRRFAVSLDELMRDGLFEAPVTGE